MPDMLGHDASAGASPSAEQFIGVSREEENIVRGDFTLFAGRVASREPLGVAGLLSIAKAGAVPNGPIEPCYCMVAWVRLSALSKVYVAALAG
jgi:hypothetical protein